MLTLLASLIALLGALLLHASTKPDTCYFSRSLHISAPPEKIFPLIDDPRAMNEWNPFVKADPNVKLSYSGPLNGLGAANDFAGDNRVGAGRVEILEFGSPLQSGDGAANGSPDKVPKPRRVYDRAAGQWVGRQLGDERRAKSRGSVAQCFRGHRKDGWRCVRERSRRIEGESRSVILQGAGL